MTVVRKGDSKAFEHLGVLDAELHVEVEGGTRIGFVGHHHLRAYSGGEVAFVPSGVLFEDFDVPDDHPARGGGGAERPPAPPADQPPAPKVKAPRAPRKKAD